MESDFAPAIILLLYRIISSIVFKCCWIHVKSRFSSAVVACRGMSWHVVACRSMSWHVVACRRCRSHVVDVVAMS
jgi:hypothetical protein